LANPDGVLSSCSVQFASSMYTSAVRKTLQTTAALTRRTWQRSYKNLAFLVTSLVLHQSAKR